MEYNKFNNMIMKYNINNIFQTLLCPCGGGESCIVTRRKNYEIIHEDNVFKYYNLPLRISCFEPYTNEQNNALMSELKYYITNS